MKKPRILVADDHPVILKALCGLLENGVGEVVGAVTDGQALVEAAQRLEPDIILADISMPRLNGLEATRALQHSVPQSKVIILTSHYEPAYVALAFKSGARGYLLKRTSLHAELSQAVFHVLAGDRYIGHGVNEEQAFADEGESLIRYRL
ncbi:MAG: response regulator transcription factor [Nitrospirae bacterium]|nr:response regulator transcription factor [Nitrospirota bacterium]